MDVGSSVFIQGEHSAIISTFLKLSFVIKIFVLALFLDDRFTHVLLYRNCFTCFET